MSEDPPYERLYREAIPSVVSVYVTATPADADGPRAGGAGSGFVVDANASEPAAPADPIVVTNQHVVRDASSVDVRSSAGEWHTGEVVGTDAYTDLAVVAVGDLPADAAALAFAEDDPVPGRPVAALGTPLGLEGSISRGIVSGANRSMPTREGFAIPDTVQTDAPINPGNSGGPLVTFDPAAGPEEDLGVEVVGVNRARGGDNIGFAVSAAVARRVVPALRADGRYHHPYLRISTIDVSPSVAAANDLPETRGVLVADVRLGPSSAALIGCEDTRRVRGQSVPVGGDVITAVDGEPVDSHESLLRHLLLEREPGEAVEVTLLRDGRELDERVTLAERPRPGAQFAA
ncbi:MAG: S1C family serine protease [Haloarculaceae archaeon]